MGLISWVLTLCLSLLSQRKTRSQFLARRSYEDSRFAAFVKSRRPYANQVKFVSADWTVSPAPSRKMRPIFAPVRLALLLLFCARHRSFV